MPCSAQTPIDAVRDDIGLNQGNGSEVLKIGQILNINLKVEKIRFAVRLAEIMRIRGIKGDSRKLA